MKKILLILFSVIFAFCVCACSSSDTNPATTNTANTTTTTITETKSTTSQAAEIQLTSDNVEEYLSFKLSKEFSDLNPNGADHILKVSPLVDGDFSGVSITVEIPLYDHWYNSYTTEVDLTANINLTKAGKVTVKHPIVCDIAELYETRGAQGENDPTYIIKSVSGTVK